MATTLELPLREVIVGGHAFRLGNLLPDPVDTGRLRYAWPVWGSSPNAPVIPRSEWNALIPDGIDEWSPHLPPLHDQDGIGMCFPTGTLVRLGSGKNKPIEKIETGDEVLTAEGNRRPVLRSMKRRHEGAMYRIAADGPKGVRRMLDATAEHPILTKDRGYVPISQLLVTDEERRGDRIAWMRFDSAACVTEPQWLEVVGRTRDALFAGDVWNLEVEGDHSYVADGIGVHNCNASATAAAMEYIRSQAGMPHVQLSGGDLYGRINDGQDQGSLLEDGLRVALGEGVASAAFSPYLEWRRATRPTPEIMQDRKRYRVVEAWVCPTFDACMSAVLRGFALISGIMWYSNYDPDRNGWLPERGTGSPGGHAVFGYKATRIGNRYGIWHQNSWADWGPRNGRCVFPESSYRGPVGGWWAVRVTVTPDGGEALPEPRDLPQLVAY